MRLKEDLYSIDKKLLIKAGKEINKDILNKIATSAKDISYVDIKDTILIEDAKRAFRNERYKMIFSPEKINKEIVNIMKGFSFPEKILAELKTIKKKMPYTYRHIMTVAILTTKIALDKNSRNQYDPKRIIRLGLTHDIGKSRISPEILNKTTPLTHTEYEILKTHPLIGYILLHYYYGRNHDKYDCASYEHHERLDGSGYPRKIKRISKQSQLISVVDVFDALMSSRPYRKIPYTLRATLDFLLDETKEKRLNKEIVYLLISYARKDKPPLDKLIVSKKKRDKPPAQNFYGKVTTG